jgi:hypothetical protein
MKLVKFLARIDSLPRERLLRITFYTKQEYPPKSYLRNIDNKTFSLEELVDLLSENKVVVAQYDIALPDDQYLFIDTDGEVYRLNPKEHEKMVRVG